MMMVMMAVVSMSKALQQRRVGIAIPAGLLPPLP
jgi:hypothetical protein